MHETHHCTKKCLQAKKPCIFQGKFVLRHQFLVSSDFLYNKLCFLVAGTNICQETTLLWNLFFCTCKIKHRFVVLTSFFQGVKHFAQCAVEGKSCTVYKNLRPLCLISLGSFLSYSSSMLSSVASASAEINYRCDDPPANRKSKRIEI